MPKTSRIAENRSLPAGTVTFLFTDIEGSTKMWQAQDAAMSTALARHDALLRQCIAAHGGHVFKTAGDAFCAAYAIATEALASALDSQRALFAERWPEGALIRVRMALATGAAQLRDNDYFGAPVNHVARLLAAGHGGQILLTEITHDLCRDRLPGGSALKSLGEHALKDIARRETVFQLCHPDLPQAFPPLKTLFASGDADTPSIAVLPFADLSQAKDQEYFADGLAEELLNVLSKIRGLRVASRTSAFYFKGKDVDVPTIAQKLNVANILEGSVRKSGTKLRITAQLIEVASDSHLWSETYNRDLHDIFEVQDDIAQCVVKELRATLLSPRADMQPGVQLKQEVQAATRGRGVNAEAYQLYLQGRFFEDRLTRDDTAKAIEYYRHAVAVDPEYALAWAGLSRAFCHQGGYSWQGTDEGFGKGRKAAERALQLDPDLAEGHASLGLIKMLYDRDWKGADASFRRALELAATNMQVMRGAAMLAGCLGRLEESIDLLSHAVKLDPLSVQAHRSLAAACLRADRVDMAEMAAEKAVELSPRGGLTHCWLGMVRLTQGRVDDAAEEFDLETHATFRLFGRVLADHARGRSAESHSALRELIAGHADGSAYQIAEANAYCGHRDLAFEWLERAYAQRDPGLAMTKVSPLLRSLHDDARWHPMLVKIGLAD